MNTERAQVGWRFWLWWMLATAVVPTVVLTILLVFFVILPDPDPRLQLGALLMFGDLFFVTMTFAQWLVLRRQISHAKWWVVAGIVAIMVGSVVGLVAGGAVRFLAFGLSGVLGAGFTEAAGLIAGGIISFAVGIPSAYVALTIAQWLVLRKHVSRAGLWLLVPIVEIMVGWVVGGVVVLVADLPAAGEVVRDNRLGTVLLGTLLLGTVPYGAITGALMVWLLRQPAAKEKVPGQAAG